jgi:NAD(P)-dependent dehydrogenase (short-subunit alcohol dehydrogenase family)
MISNQKVVIVTGSSSGIGREISLVLAKNGFITYATMRNLQKGSDLKSIAEIERLPLHFFTTRCYR